MESKRPVWESEEVRVALLNGPDHLHRLGAESVNPHVMRPAARLFAVRMSVQFPPLTEHLGRIPGQPGRLAKRYPRSPGSGLADSPAKALRALVKHEADDEDPVRLPSPRPINSTTKSMSLSHHGTAALGESLEYSWSATRSIRSLMSCWHRLRILRQYALYRAN
jgi:hypothetical protein